MAMIQGASIGIPSGLAKSYNQASTPGPTVSAMQSHANKLASYANELDNLNGRLATAISRMTGPSPEKSPSAPLPASQDGVLHYATLEAQRISNGLDELNSLISKLDELI